MSPHYALQISSRTGRTDTLPPILPQMPGIVFPDGTIWKGEASIKVSYSVDLKCAACCYLMLPASALTKNCIEFFMLYAKHGPLVFRDVKGSAESEGPNGHIAELKASENATKNAKRGGLPCYKFRREENGRLTRSWPIWIPDPPKTV